MFGFPSSTEIKKQLPKKAIYAKFDMSASQRERFDADISRIDIFAINRTSSVRRRRGKGNIPTEHTTETKGIRCQEHCHAF